MVYKASGSVGLHFLSNFLRSIQPLYFRASHCTFYSWNIGILCGLAWDGLGFGNSEEHRKE